MPGGVASSLLLVTGLFSLATVGHAGSMVGKPDVTIGGRVKLDAVYNDRSPGNGRLTRSELAFSPASIPLSGNNPDSFHFNLRESRLWATGRLPLFNRDLAAYAEIDFYPVDRSQGRAQLSNKPRLRHAYATYGGLTAGKTYTTFLNVTAYPETNDTNGPVGILNVRQELLRYRKSFAWGSMTLSLEEPGSRLTTTTGNSVRANDADWTPDIITRLDFKSDRVDGSVSAMARQIRSNGLVPAAMADSQWGAAVSVAGRIYTTGQDNIRFSVAGGNILGRYLSYNAFDDGVMDNNGQIDLTEMFGAYIAYQHWWTTNLRSSLTVGYAQADHDLSVAPDTVDKRYYSTHLNLIWSPTLNSSIGAEWLHGYREQEDGSEGNLDRLQFSVIYKF